MKLKFKHQQFQDDAVNAVADLFKGQEKTTMTFSVETNVGPMNLQLKNTSVCNRILIDNDTLISNMHRIQRKNKLKLSSIQEWRVKSEELSKNNSTLNSQNSTLKKIAPQFSIEMETGTGKTYVYTKTILELNKRYGFTKFIIVVPSVAIREGVKKSFDVTKEHFANLYDSIPCRYFIYNSSKLSDVRQFATSSTIEIMIINIDAFKKAENIINQEQDKLNGEAAINYIKDTMVIVF